MHRKGSGRHILGCVVAVELPRSPRGTPGVRALEERRQPGLLDAPDADCHRHSRRQRVRDRDGILRQQHADRF